MKIKVSKACRQSYSIDRRISLNFDGNYPFIKRGVYECNLKAEMFLKDNIAFVKGGISGNIDLVCQSSLLTYVHPLDISFESPLLEEGSSIGKYHLQAYYIKNDEIDMLAFTAEEIIISLPSVT